MNSIVKLKWLGGTEAFRTRGLNVGDLSLYESDVMTKYYYKNQGVLFITELGAIVLKPYMDQMAAYNMSIAKDLSYSSPHIGSALLDFRTRFTAPHGWYIGYTAIPADKNGKKDIIAVEHSAMHFVKDSGKYFDASFGGSGEYSYKEWDDYFYQALNKSIKDTPGGMLVGYKPQFSVMSTAWGERKLLFWGNYNNIIDVPLGWPFAGSDTASQPMIDKLGHVIKWFIRSWDKDWGPEKDYPGGPDQLESTKSGTTNYLMADQGLLFAVHRPAAINSVILDHIRDNIMELRLCWIGEDNKVKFLIKFIFSLNYELTIEFSATIIDEEAGDPLSGDLRLQRKYSSSPVTIRVPFKNNPFVDNKYAFSLMFIDGRMVFHNIKNEYLTSVTVPQFMTVERKDLQGKKYAGVTGEETTMYFSAYGACGVLLRPLLYHNEGIMNSPEFKQGEKLSDFETDYDAIVPISLSMQAIEVATEVTPDYGAEAPPASGSDKESEEAGYKYSVTMSGDPVEDGSMFFSGGAVKEPVSIYTPILFDVKLRNDPLALPADRDVLPDSLESEIDLLGLQLSKSVNEAGECTPGNLNVVFHSYGGMDFDRFMNAPFKLQLGALDTLVHDYSRDWKGNHAGGTVPQNVDLVDVGLFLLDRKVKTRSGSEFGDKKITIACTDIIKRLQNTIFSKKESLDGLSHVAAIQYLMNKAHMSGRLLISEASLEKAVNDPVLPLSANGGGPQWIASVGDNVWEWMGKIREFSGWVLYVDNLARLIYRHYDRTVLNRDYVVGFIKYLLTDRYNWTDTGLIGQNFTIIPVAESSEVESDNYRTIATACGINAIQNQKIQDATLGEVRAKVGDRIAYVYKNVELEEKLGETRICAFESKFLSNVESIRKVARSIAKIYFRPSKIMAFKIECAERMLELNLYDPIGYFNSEKQTIEIYEVTSMNLNANKNSMTLDIEARTYPI